MASERHRRAKRRWRRRKAALNPVNAERIYKDTVLASPTSSNSPPGPPQTRGRCPVCGRREKLTASGVLGKHTGLDKKTDCDGKGREPE